MGDIYSISKRSEIMAKIKSSNTSPEQKIYLLIRHSLDFRWRIDKNRNDLPGRPDFVIPGLKCVIFIDGCFFHNCPIHGHFPKSNSQYWKSKIIGNKARDKINRKKLDSLGYTVISFWEHDISSSRVLVTETKLRKILTKLKHQRKSKII